MKIISWNCNGAFRKKYNLIDTLDVDILIIQECENPEVSTHTYKDWAGEYLWCGENKNKGLAIFARKGNKITPLSWNGSFHIQGLSNNNNSLKWQTNDLKEFLPCLINNKFTLLGVWTKQADSPNFGYMGQFWKFLQIHRKDLMGDNTIICGDFNSNKIWDASDRWWNHSDVVEELDYIGIHSLYHHMFDEEQGEESQSTFYMHRKLEKPYHIDYAFLSDNLLNRASFYIGSRDIFLEASDHLPIVFEINS